MTSLSAKLPYNYTFEDIKRKISSDFPPVKEATYKMYKQDNSSFGTVAELEMNDFKESRNDMYAGKSYLELQHVRVDKEERKKGIAREFNRLAVLHSIREGCQGRLSLMAITKLEPLTPMIHFLNGWRPVNRKKAIELKKLVKSGAKTGYEKFTGRMYLPKRQMKKYLRRKAIAKKTYKLNK